jgi:hypothetical protein
MIDMVATSTPAGIRSTVSADVKFHNQLTNRALGAREDHPRRRVMPRTIEPTIFYWDQRRLFTGW